MFSKTIWKAMIAFSTWVLPITTSTSPYGSLQQNHSKTRILLFLPLIFKEQWTLSSHKEWFMVFSIGSHKLLVLAGFYLGLVMWFANTLLSLNLKATLQKMFSWIKIKEDFILGTVIVCAEKGLTKSFLIKQISA